MPTPDEDAQDFEDTLRPSRARRNLVGDDEATVVARAPQPEPDEEEATVVARSPFAPDRGDDTVANAKPSLIGDHDVTAVDRLMAPGFTPRGEATAVTRAPEPDDDDDVLANETLRSYRPPPVEANLSGETIKPFATPGDDLSGQTLKPYRAPDFDDELSAVTIKRHRPPVEAKPQDDDDDEPVTKTLKARAQRGEEFEEKTVPRPAVQVPDSELQPPKPLVPAYVWLLVGAAAVVGAYLVLGPQP
ncbi:MAG: hypothetical protein AAF799_41840 [Myxococcota bacterium]